MSRIQEIKENVHHFKEHDFFTTMTYEDYLWLIEKAEKMARQETFLEESLEHFESLGTDFIRAENPAMAIQDFLSDEKTFEE